jgi:hypothetical protein
MDNCREWEEFEASDEDQVILGGLGNTNTFRTNHEGKRISKASRGYSVPLPGCGACIGPMQQWRFGCPGCGIIQRRRPVFAGTASGKQLSCNFIGINPLLTVRLESGVFGRCGKNWGGIGLWNLKGRIDFTQRREDFPPLLEIILIKITSPFSNYSLLTIFISPLSAISFNNGLLLISPE